MSFHKYTLAIFSLLISLFEFSSCSKDDGDGGSDISVNELTGYKWKLSYTEVDDNSAAKVTYTMYFGQNGKGFSTTKQTIADVGLADIWNANSSTEFTYSISGSAVSTHESTGTSTYTYNGIELVSKNSNSIGNMSKASLTSSEKALIRAVDGTSGTTAEDSWLVGTWESTSTVGTYTSRTTLALESESSGTIKFADKSSTKSYTINGWSYDPSSKELDIYYSKKYVLKLTVKSKVQGKSFYTGYDTYNKVDGGSSDSSGAESDNDDSNYISSGSGNGHEYVDLGLSSGALWATCNVGASKIEDSGDYYAWGEISTKTTYAWDNYKYYSDSKLTKYCTNSSMGVVDNKTELELADDVAHIKWGGNWRIPSKKQYEELINECTITSVTYNGVKGVKVASKKNDNCIFIPANGRNSSFKNSLYYWTRTLFDGQVFDDVPNDNQFGYSYNGLGILEDIRYCAVGVRPILQQ